VAPKWSPEGLPGPGLRNLCAGAAPCSISKTPPEDALREQDEAMWHAFLALVKHSFLSARFFLPEPRGRSRRDLRLSDRPPVLPPFRAAWSICQAKA